MDGEEWVHVWHDPVLDHLEMHHARYVTHTFPRHMHDTYVVGLIEAGVQCFSYRGSQRVTPAGGIFVINPGEAHTGGAVTEAGYTYRTLYPAVRLVQRAVEDIADGRRTWPVFPTPILFDPELAAQLRALHAASELSPSPLERESRFLKAFALLVSRYAELKPPERAARPERHAVRRVRRHIEEHYARRVTLTELSQLVGFSRFHLLRVFEQEVGLPPHAYLESVRVRHAQRLLRSGLAPAQAAYDLGFSTQSHLTRRFKQLLGVTPGRYVKGATSRATTPGHRAASSERRADQARLEEP